MPLFDFKRQTTLTDGTVMPQGWGYVPTAKMGMVPNVSAELFKQQSLVVPRDLTELYDDQGWTVVNTVIAHAITIDESPTMYTNKGATDVILFTLPPTTDCIIGRTRFSFFTLDAVPVRIVTYAAGADIKGFGGVGPFPVGADATRVESGGQAGEFLSLMYIRNGVWGAMAANGDWE